GTFGSGQAPAQQGNNLAVLAAALAGVLIKNGFVERLAQNFRLLANILVAPVAGSTDDDGAAYRRHRLDGPHQRPDGIRIVAIVDDQGGALVVEHVETSGRGRGVADEARKRLFNGLPRQAQRPAGGHGGHGVVDLETDEAAMGQRNPAEWDGVL